MNSERAREGESDRLEPFDGSRAVGQQWAFGAFQVESVDILRDSVAAELLGKLLPLYQADQKRWPLWTYRREHDGSPSKNWSRPWQEDSEVPAWRDRLRWSSLLPLLDIWTILKKSAGEPLTYSPGRQYRYAASNKERFRIPAFFLTHEAAILAAYAHPTAPSRVEEIVVPGPWSPTLPLDLEDYREILHRFAEALQGGSDAMFLRLVWQRPEDRGKEGDRARGLELLSRLGFSADRSRTRKNTLAAPYMKQLSTEAREIVEEFRKWQTPTELADLVKLLVGETDLDDIDRERLMRDRPLGLVKGHTATTRAAIHLRFPYLTYSEVETLLKNSTRSTAVAAAKALLMTRLSADLTLKRLDNLLSEA